MALAPHQGGGYHSVISLRALGPQQGLETGDLGHGGVYSSVNKAVSGSRDFGSLALMSSAP